MFIEDLFTWIKFLHNKGQARYYSPEQVINALNHASLDLFNQDVGNYAANKVITNDLRKFLIHSPELNITNGKAPLPANYALYTEIQAGDKPCDVIPSGFWNNKKNDPIEGPTEDYPICTIYGSTIEFLPTSITKFRISYFKYPVKAKYAYTFSSDGRSTIFDELNSTDIDWPEISHNRLVHKTLTYLGLNLKDADLMQFEGFKRQMDG